MATKQEIEAFFGQVGHKSYTLITRVTDEVMDFITKGPRRTANCTNGPMWVRTLFWELDKSRFESDCWSQVGEKFAVGGSLVFRPKSVKKDDGTYEMVLNDKGEPIYDNCTFCPEEEDDE